MGKKYLVLGAGRQGTAAAWDLAKYGNASQVDILDTDMHRLFDVEKSLSSEFPDVKIVGRLESLGELLTPVMGRPKPKYHACVNALPYQFIEPVSALAVMAGISVCDLGCDTKSVLAQKKLTEAAKAANISIVSDCGLAPGTSTMLARLAIKRLGRKPDRVSIYCGGLPAQDQSIFKYKLVFSPTGLFNNYAAKAWVLSGGDVLEVDSLTGREDVEFANEKLEAFYTHGGASLLPWSLQREGVRNFSYKTLRYPGHLDALMLLRELGLLDQDNPAALEAWRGAIAKRLTGPADSTDDYVYLRAVASIETFWPPPEGLRSITLDMVFRDAGKFNSMERSTGFSAGVVACLQASKKVKPGVWTPDEAIDVNTYFKEMAKRGFQVIETSNKLLA